MKQNQIKRTAPSYTTPSYTNDALSPDTDASNQHHTRAIQRHKKLLFICTSFLIAQAGSAAPTQVPLEAAFAVSPNIMILLDNSGSMKSYLKDADGNDSTRIDVAKDAVTSLIQQTKNVRFCLSKFRYEKGARMTSDMQCTTDKADLISITNAISANTWTPLSESYYDVTRYFRGKKAYFGKFGDYEAYPSPVQYRCQTNAVIVVTDGEPTRDWDENTLPTDSGNYEGESRSLPDWDNLDNDDKTAYTGNSNYSDYYLDDLALYGNQTDLKSAGTDNAGVSWDDPKFPLQNIKTHTIGLQLDMAMLQDAADYGKGEYISANSADELVKALQDAIVTSLERQGSGAGATQSDIALDKDGRTNLYFTEYDTSDWSGDLKKIQLEETRVNGQLTLKAVQKWSAAERLDALTNPVSSRVIFTPNASLDGLMDFTRDAMPDILLKEINKNNTTVAKNIVDYVRGRTNLNNKYYRERDTLLGDLINSRATFVQGRNFGYIDDTYEAYVVDNRKNRKPMIYVGGNDGILHAFDEDTGEEVFGFVPNTVLKKLNKFRSKTYSENHQYLVDGEFTTVDTKLTKNGKLEWSTVLASPLGGGLKGMFMLDITEPNAGVSGLRDKLFKWEITQKTRDSADHAVYKRMGFMINPPKIVRFRIPESASDPSKYHDKWVLLAGNGVHSKYGKYIGAASVFVIDLDTGELITELLLDNAKNPDGSNKYTAYADGNGVTSVAAVDYDANTYIDQIYAADLKGQIWRYNYNDAGTPKSSDAEYIRKNLEAAYVDPGDAPVPIFAATGGEFNGSGTNIPQPITAELTVTGAPSASGSRDGVMIFFGTGQFFDFTHLLDDVNDKVQTMYAFWDRGISDAGQTWTDQELPIKRDRLQQQTIIERTVNGKPVRELSAINAIGYTPSGGNPSQLGWLMDMPLRGERITRKPVGLFEHMAFFTQSPISKTDPCIEGIDGWSMIAKKDTATPIDVTLVGSSTTSFLGTKQTGDSIHDPIFVELSDGQFVAPVIETTAGGGGGSGGGDIKVKTTIQVQKDYSRSSWKRLQF